MGKKKRKRRKIRVNPRVLGFLIAGLIRLTCLTLRIRIEDRPGILKENPGFPLLWVFWHNRMFVLPYVYQRRLTFRTGAVMTSASGDGDVIADVMRRFGVASVRGSSSRKGVGALKSALDWVRRDQDIVFTPDGPRGPCYRMAPGIARLAQNTGARIFPVHVEYNRFWRLKTWDRFIVPKPFSRAEVTLDHFIEVEPTDSPVAFEAERVRIENVLKDAMEFE